jgi:hypothetical protein
VALAAIAALWTALQNRAWLKTALRPVLAATAATITDPLVMKALPHPQFHIANAGGGVARDVTFIWTAGGYVVDGSSKGGIAPFFRSGERIEIAAALPISENYQAVVTCLDVSGNAYAWSVDGHTKEAARTWWRKTPRFDAAACFESFYPDLPLDHHAAAPSWSLLTPATKPPPAIAYPTHPPPVPRKLGPPSPRSSGPAG